MKKLLIIFTRKYPYDFGEPFLECEIDKHSKYFDDILVLSQDVSANSKQTRVPPVGIKFMVTASDQRKKLRKKDMLNTPFMLFHPSINMTNEFVGRKLKFKQKLFLAYFECRCDRLYRETKNIIDNIDINQYEHIVFYSYWLFANAYTSLLLKSYLLKEREFSGKIVLISRAHRYDIYEEENKLNYLPFRNILLNGLDYIFPCSKDGSEYLKKKWPDVKSNIQTAYLGTIDYGLSKVESQIETFHIVSCSRVVKVKRLEKLIDELSLVKNKKNIIWTHIGGGVEGKIDYYNKIQDYANKKLNNINFEFLGALQNKDVYEYYKNHQVDVFVNVSFSEGLPVSLMEAISFGIPIIATDVGGSREIIKENSNGFLLPRDFEVGTLKQKIEIMLNDSDEERKSRRDAARALWENYYCADKNYNDFANKISNLSNSL